MTTERTGAPSGWGRYNKPLSKAGKIRALIESGLAEDREDAIAQLVDMGEIDEDDE
jgi:hypothetical protein